MDLVRALDTMIKRIAVLDQEDCAKPSPNLQQGQSHQTMLSVQPRCTTYATLKPGNHKVTCKPCYCGLHLVTSSFCACRTPTKPSTLKTLLMQASQKRKSRGVLKLIVRTAPHHKGSIPHVLQLFRAAPARGMAVTFHRAKQPTCHRRISFAGLAPEIVSLQIQDPSGATFFTCPDLCAEKFLPCMSHR